jgi:hypothetical protein
LACWGRNTDGQATPPAGTFTQVSSGGTHACALETDGSLACWGSNEAGQSTPPAGTFTQVNAGVSFTCGIQTDGTLACWGRNDYGQATPPAGAFTQVTTGQFHACAVATDSRLHCWGRNDNGEAPVLELAPAELSGEVLPCDEAYSQTFTASGGTPHYGYVLTAGSLPQGLSLSPAGLLSGTPSEAGIFTFTVQARDANTVTVSAERTYSLQFTHRPSAANGAANGLEDSALVFAQADFAYSDADGDPFTWLQITSLPASGSLFLDADSDGAPDAGETVTAGQEISATLIGQLTYLSAANENGDFALAFKVSDGYFYNADPAYALWLNITPVNDAPSFTPGANVSVQQDSGAYSAAWANDLLAGPADESGQALDFIVSASNPALFSAQPAIAADGTLSFTPAPGASGTATITVSLHDDGGTADGGDDTSATITFTITIGAASYYVYLPMALR